MTNRQMVFRTVFLTLISVSLTGFTGCVVREHDRDHDHDFHDRDFHDGHHDDHFDHHDDHGMSQPARDIVASA